MLSVLPVSDLLPPLEALISGRVDDLRSLAEQEPSEMNKVLLEKELAVLGALSHHIYPTIQEGEQHPIFLLLVQIFPVLQSIINTWNSDYDIVEVRDMFMKGHYCLFFVFALFLVKLIICNVFLQL